MMKLTHLDLFSGIGGFAIAAQANGFETVAFCEIEPYAQQVLIEKFGAYPDAESLRKLQQEGRKQDFWRWISDMGGEKRTQPKRCLKRDGRPMLHSNIFTLDGTQYRGVSLLTGGFPCQPFSVAGKRRGAEDDRALWPEMFRVIREAEPTAVVAENVPGIINMELDRCISDLESIGYSVWPIVVPACAVDARHRRDRVWIVGNRKDQRCSQPHDRIGHGERERRDCEKVGRGLLDAVERTSEDVAYTNRQGPQGRDGSELRECSGEWIARTSNPSMADTVQSGGREWRRSSGSGRWERSETETGIAGGSGANAGYELWLPEPDVGRVAHGIPNQAHRLRALGNAIVPQVAQEIIRCMKEGGVWQPELEC